MADYTRTVVQFWQRRRPSCYLLPTSHSASDRNQSRCTCTLWEPSRRERTPKPTHKLPTVAKAAARHQEDILSANQPAPANHSKTDPFRQGTTVYIFPAEDSTLCPVRALTTYLGRPRGSSSGPCFVFREGQPLTKQKLNQLVKEMSRHVGLGLERYSTHSFRIGAATTAAAAGIPDWKIRMLGRWLSDSY